MPEIVGLELEKRMNESIGMMSKEMVGAVHEMSDALKEAIIGTQGTANTMGAMIETMGKARYSFMDFMSTLERTNVVLYSTARIFGDLSQTIKGTTSSIEGFLSAFTTLSTRTLPDISKHVAESIAGYDKEIKKLEEQKIAHENTVKGYDSAISAANEYIQTIIDKKGKATATEKKLAGEMTIGIEQLNEKRDGEKNIIAGLTESIGTTKTASAGLSSTLTGVAGGFTVLITVFMALISAYDSAMLAKREVIYTLGRLGLSYADNVAAMERFDKEFTQIANRWGMFREEMAKALTPLTALGVGVGPGGVATSINKIRETLEVAADLTGGMLRGFGVETGITTRALGLLSTTFDLKGRALGDVFEGIAVEGQKSVLGMQRYITEVTSMIETTRRYGGGVESAKIMMSGFEEQIKKGTLAIGDLARLSSPAMWSPQQQGAVVAMMQQYAPSEAKGLGIFGKDLISGMVELTRSAKDQPALLMQGISKTINAMMPGGATPQQQQYFSQQFLQALTGLNIPVYEIAGIFKDPTKLSEMLRPKQVKTMTDLYDSMEKTYARTQTYQEAMKSAVEKIRDVILYAFGGPMMAADIISGKTGKEIGSALATDKGITLESISRLWGGAPGYITKEEAKAKRQSPKETKQTGGYIPEDAQYWLEAGEQVRRPGEGGGGNVSISLGGLSVTVGDRGDMRNQLDEAFERLKRETISEIENQWNEQLVTH